MSAYALPMFPLEHPVLPGQLIPLHLFEPRYLALAEHLRGELEADFGTVGIERGREVGGDDVRADAGVVVRVLEMGDLPDGRVSLLAVGTRRIRVNEWLGDAPYPRAMVTDWPDDVVEEGLEIAAANLASAVHALVDAARRNQPGLEVEVPAIDPDHLDTSIWRLITFSGLGPLDTAALLRTPDPIIRSARACAIIDERRELLDALGDNGR
ncbi:MAG: LON peptidase substrate-binding domain-containing protein [Acidimicrobiaceae bacterium]|jgi:Lon protease-like protein